ncbi:MULTISPECIES: hypothetical protein [Streptomyces]|uniref:Integral membrane protein n=1 Tax=Streptomyces nondiastaticus TaxID=3154512 RepID=A0ABW6TTQ3_9ACTN|nr:hypothetical protein [Streptomyces sp. VNUA116]WKU44267.1 hypothetical protein Q3V23_09340 [Streptomyces sp. VNUA116]
MAGDGTSTSGEGCIAAVFTSARTSAHWLGFGRELLTEYDSEGLRFLQGFRAFLGTVATFALIWTYGVDGGWSSVLEDGLTKLFLAPLVLIVAGPLVITGFILYAPKETRPWLRGQLKFPLMTVGVYLGIPLLILSVTAGTWWLIYHYISEWEFGLIVGPLLSLLLSFWLLAGLIWLALFLFFASGVVARTAFNTGIVHPMLPAVFTTLVVWTLNVVSLGDGLPNGPLYVKIAAFLGGPLSVTALSAWELYVLRTRHGVRIRGAGAA